MTRIMLIEPGTGTKDGVMRILASIGTNKADWKFPPLDLMGIGGILRKNGIEDFVILDSLNTGLTHAQTKQRITEEKPELVIFTFTAYTAKNDMLVASAAKEVSKGIRTLAVNFAAESYPGSLMDDFPDLDYLAYHEPEYPCLDLVRSGYEPAGVCGIYYRNDGKVVKNPERPLLDLDDIGVPAHDKIPLDIYRSPYQKRKPMSVTCFSRGCVNQCAHCLSKFLQPLRKRSYESIFEEFELLRSLGVKELRFFDAELTCDMDWAEGLFEKMIEKKIDITFSCNTRADTVRPTLLEKMKKAGCHLLSIGVNSADQQMLDNAGRNETVGQVLEAVKLIKKRGFRLTTFTTFGSKGETGETMRRTIRLIRDIDPDLASFSIAVPVLGTEFYDYLKKNGLLDESAPPEAYDPNLPPVYSYPGLSSREMYEISLQAYRSFYLRPAYIIKRLLRSYNRADDFKSLFYFLRRYVA